MESTPIVFITGNVPQSLMGTDSFQEADISGMTMPVTKHNYLVTRVEKLADIVREAFFIASSGRPGPVLIDIPKDVQFATSDYVPAEKAKVAHYQPRTEGDPDRIAQLVLLPIVRATLRVVDTFEESARGSGGFGHTGLR